MAETASNQALNSFALAMAAITDAQAQLLGMQAENMQREATGASMAYRDTDFVTIGQNTIAQVREHCEWIR